MKNIKKQNLKIIILSFFILFIGICSINVWKNPAYAGNFENSLKEYDELSEAYIEL